jgi:hypothetical protein
MAELKTKQNNASVKEFLETVQDESKKKDCDVVLKMMKRVTGEKPMMWGGSIIGFGKYHYKSERSKQEGDWFITGFSPRKQNLTIYIIAGVAAYGELMKKLGKCKTGAGCLYMNKLADVDIAVLEELVARSYKYMKEKHAK